jgi:hypothetical protein
MSLPTSEPIPSDDDHLAPARMRRKRRLDVLQDANEQVEFKERLVRRATPSIDFFLFSLLAGLVVGLAILFDSQALFVLAALFAPFMAPVVGLALAASVGSVRFFIQSLLSFLLGSAFVFGAGALTGYLVTNVWPELEFNQVGLHAAFSWPDFALLTLGAALASFLIVRNQTTRPLAASIALAYELYLPLGVAGFGLTSQLPGLWPDGLVVFGVYLMWAALVGALTLLITGLRPTSPSGYTISAVLALAGALALFFVSTANVEMRPQAAVVKYTSATPTLTISPTVTLTATPQTPTLTPSPTNTLVPTRTPTITLTPAPTPVWAKVRPNEFGGVLVRAEPNFTAPIVRSLSNDYLVEILPDIFQGENTTWVKIRTEDGDEGWVVRSLLITATPAPDW